MNCCFCQGVCFHTGAHSYCAQHNPNGSGFPIGQYTPTPIYPAPIYIPMETKKCEHCYCKEIDDRDGNGISHLKCCNCGNRKKIARKNKKEPPYRNGE